MIHETFKPTAYFWYWGTVSAWLATDVFKKPADEVPDGQDWSAMSWAKKLYMTGEWNQAYEVVEYLVNTYAAILAEAGFRHEPHQKRQITDGLILRFNHVLEREMSGYRFVEGVLTPLVEPVEIEAIAEAMEKTGSGGFEGATIHLKTALSKLGQKPEPDYRNACKEAISAVESVVRRLTGQKDLSKALERLSADGKMHGALRSACEKLYGYTSDEGGIRHAIIEENNVGYDEAKFLIVTCAAFVNLLIAKS